MKKGRSDSKRRDERMDTGTGAMKNGGRQMKRLRDVQRQPGAKGKELGGLEEPPPCTLPQGQQLPSVAGQTHLQWLALGLLGNVTGIFLQSLDTHHHGFRLCEAAHQAREQARQGQGIG